MRNRIILFCLIAKTALTYSQKFTTDEGDIDNIKGISNYSIVFEYSSDLEIPNYNSEKDFLEFQVNKREKKETGSGEKFRKLWFENRINIYEPKFIEQFNLFKLKKRKINVGKNNANASHIMVVKISFIYPGYDVGVYEEEAKLGVKITVHKNQDPDNILYSTKTFRIHGNGESHTEYDRVMTAYSELGRWTSKFFCRKT